MVKHSTDGGRASPWQQKKGGLYRESRSIGGRRGKKAIQDSSLRLTAVEEAPLGRDGRFSGKLGQGLGFSKRKW